MHWYINHQDARTQNGLNSFKKDKINTYFYQIPKQEFHAVLHIVVLHILCKYQTPRLYPKLQMLLAQVLNTYREVKHTIKFKDIVFFTKKTITKLKGLNPL